MKTNQAKIGRIWQTADDINQAVEWASKYLRMGALQVDLKSRRPWKEGEETLPDDKFVDVIITLVRTPETEVNMILGYKIEAEEWMTEDYPIGTPVFVNYDDGVIKAGVVHGRRTTVLLSGTKTDYFIQYVGGNTFWVSEDDVTDSAVVAGQRLHAEITRGWNGS